jgi:hypothetical protein
VDLEKGFLETIHLTLDGWSHIHNLIMKNNPLSEKYSMNMDILKKNMKELLQTILRRGEDGKSLRKINLPIKE